MADPAKNFAKTTVSTGYTAGETSIALTGGDGAKLPDPGVSGEFNLVWWNSTDFPDSSDDPNVEIVRCTARTTDALTVIRAREGTADVNHNTGGKSYKMILTFTQKTYDDKASLSGATFTGDVGLGANNLTLTGSIASDGSRVTKGWFDDLQVTNAIAGSITGNAGTVTTNANLTGIVTSSGNATAIANKAIAIAKLADGTDGNLITWDANGVIDVVATGDSGEVLTSNGAGSAPTFQDAGGGGGFTKSVYTTSFEGSGRFGQGVSNSGANTFGTQGLIQSSGATQDSYAYLQMNTNNPLGDMWDDDPEFWALVSVITAPTEGQWYFGLGGSSISGTALTFTARQIGFHIIYTSSTAVLSASNSDGTTETATDITGGVTVTSTNRFHAVKDGSTNIKFYVQNTLKATHTTNLPSGETQSAEFKNVINNKNTATTFSGVLGHAGTAHSYA